jgi:putative ubiquitin-RnfH superfamily antitoxin RatB of RatAB toxin-antitoxin module
VTRLRVEVVYALADVQHSVELSLPGEATIGDALDRVRNLPEFSGVDIDNASVGIFGAVIADRSQRLSQGDRVEIYRPLTIDPMTARRLRANRRAQ